MKYYSTRDKNVSLSAAEAVKMGLSRDGGLLTPTRIPQIDRAFLERLIPMEYADRKSTRLNSSHPSSSRMPSSA